MLVDVVREAGHEQRAHELGAPGVAQARVSEERPLPARGGEELVAERIVGRARGEPASRRRPRRSPRSAARRARSWSCRRADPRRSAARRAPSPDAPDSSARIAAPGRRLAQEPEDRGLARPIRVGDEVDPALQLDRALRSPPLAQDRAAAPRRLDAHLPQLRHLRHRHLRRSAGACRAGGRQHSDSGPAAQPWWARRAAPPLPPRLIPWMRDGHFVHVSFTSHCPCITLARTSILGWTS